MISRGTSASRPCARPRRAGYWRDVGTLDAFWQANLDLVAVQPPLFAVR